MKLFGYELKRKERREESTPAGSEVKESAIYEGYFREWMESRSKPMLLSAVYRCVDLISDAVGVLPLETYRIDTSGFKTYNRNSGLYDILNLEPNENMSRFVFFKTLMASVLLTGNGYAYIERINGVVEQLIYIPSNYVTIEWLKDSDGAEHKRYRVSANPYFVVKGLIEPADMIHILNFSYDGIIGISTLSHARQTLEIATNSESHASGFFKGGANTAGVLTVEGVRMNAEQKEQNYREWKKRTNPTTGNPNGIVILEGNMKYQTLTISPKDSQLLESRQFNVIDICRFFSVSPVKAFDLSKSSYSTIEASQLEFLSDTVLSVITKIELELNRKILTRPERKNLKIEFNTSAILRTDKAAQATYWNTMFQIGAVTPNEIRREINMPKLDNGDKSFVQVNVQTLDNAVKEKIEENSQNVIQKKG